MDFHCIDVFEPLDSVFYMCYLDLRPYVSAINYLFFIVDFHCLYWSGLYVILFLAKIFTLVYIVSYTDLLFKFLATTCMDMRCVSMWFFFVGGM